MKILKNFHTPIKISSYNLWSFSYWLRFKSALNLLNDKVKVVNSCVLKNMDLKNCGSKLVRSRHFSLSESLWNNRHAIFLIGMSIKLPKDIKYVLFEYNSFIKSPRKMKGCLVIIYIQEQISESKEIMTKVV